MKSSLRVEFHCHSRYSIDSLNKIPDLLKTAHKRGIDRLVITDHNTIRGALEAQALDGELVIVGEEIKTTKGELLASFVTDEIPEGLEPLEAIHRLRKQGAFISVSHPFDLQRSGWQLTDLMFILPLVDAIEVFNSRCVNPAFNDQAFRLAEEQNLAGTVGSDVHALVEVGRSTLLIPWFETAEELRAVIRQGIPQTRLSSPLIHLTSRWAYIVNRMTLPRSAA
jgi:predicted metal-dependent phosphoesterase TrpH